METPVLYFYGSSDAPAQVRVLFPKGTITEWYPKGVLTRTYDAIEWRNVTILRNAEAGFPTGGSSHYYAARETDSAPVQVGRQKEKFLFYRGVGTFPLPLLAKVLDDGSVFVKKDGIDVVPGVILFENRGGVRRYRVAGTVESEMVLAPHSLEEGWASLLSDLERLLVDQGLYAKEARAMIETWRDSWFEEGSRLFYIVPREAVDSILPLQIRPAPVEVARVFVGRMEIITPAVQYDVRRRLRSAIALRSKNSAVFSNRSPEGSARTTRR